MYIQHSFRIHDAYHSMSSCSLTVIALLSFRQKDDLPLSTKSFDSMRVSYKCGLHGAPSGQGRSAFLAEVAEQAKIQEEEKLTLMDC